MKNYPLSPQKKNVLIYHHRLATIPGGCDYLPLLFIAELQQRGYEVTLAVGFESDLELVARLFQVDLDVQKVKVLLLKPRSKFVRHLDVAVLPFYRTWRLKKLAKHADVCISLANMFDFGRPAHHVVYHLRRFGDRAFTNFCLHGKQLLCLPLFMQKLRTFLADFLRTMLRMRTTRKIIADPREHIYVPSRYVSDAMRAFYGPFNCTLFYPPTTFDVPLIKVERDPLSVVYIGWITREKGVLEIIDIVDRAREFSGRDIRLHLAGPLPPCDFSEKLKHLVAEKKWVKLVGSFYGQEKAVFLLSGTYAIHAERDEAFGICVTEYLKAGCIPIVPDEGGTPEVVANPALTYHTNEDAANILVRLLSDEAFRREQLDRCKERAKEFSFERYMETQHKTLDSILERQI